MTGTMFVWRECMSKTKKIGIIICDRYRRCAGGKCLQAMREKAGAFSVYKDTEVELVGFTTCDGCPGSNIEHAGDEMVKSGAEIIHLATGMFIGYPPCRNISSFRTYLKERHQIKIIVGTHPIPKKYFDMHTFLGTWKSVAWKNLIKPTTAYALLRAKYD
jgi:predicted metal-binding protein